MTDSAQAYRVYSPSKIYLSPTARAWAREWGMSDAEMAQYLIQRHQESGDAFAGDVGEAAGRDSVSGFPPQQDALAGDVGVASGGAGVHGFPSDPLAGDVGPAPRSKRFHDYPQGQTAFDNDVGEAAAAQRLLETEYPFE